MANNWINWEGTWVNMNFIKRVFVKQTSAKQWIICAIEQKGDIEEGWEVSKKVFNNKEDAQQILDAKIRDHRFEIRLFESIQQSKKGKARVICDSELDEIFETDPIHS